MLRTFERTRPYPYTWRESVRWPIARALVGNSSFRVQTRAGLVFDLNLVSVIEKHVLLAADKHPAYLWEPQTSKLLGRVATSAHQVLVAGAYIGDLILPIARAMPAGGSAHGFEPFAWSYDQFVYHCKLNRADNVRTWPYGLWNTSGERLNMQGEPALGRLVTADAGGIETISIDDYVAQQNLPGVDMMALDLEGGEINALQGATHLLKRSAETAPEIIFEINSAQTDWSNGLAQTDVIRLLHEFDYKVYAVRDFNATLSLDGFPVEVVSIDTTWLGGPPHGFNLFATKRPDRLAELGLHLLHNTSPKLILGRTDAKHQPAGFSARNADRRGYLLS
jgi:FkbM family methyltransferase